MWKTIFPTKPQSTVEGPKKVEQKKGPSFWLFFKEKSEVSFKTETLAYLPVFENMKHFINVMDNLVKTSNQLGCNNDCYDKVCHNSCYYEAGCNSSNDKAGLNSCCDKAGCNSCYNEAGRMGILLRILQEAKARGIR